MTPCMYMHAHVWANVATGHYLQLLHWTLLAQRFANQAPHACMRTRARTMANTLMHVHVHVRMS